MPKRDASWRKHALFVPVILLILPVVLVFVPLYLIASFCSHVALHVLIWSWWCLRGRDVLFVYSDSPIWHDYIEERILPRLGERAIVLNWSQRKSWRRVSLARMAFAHFGGREQFNPLAVVFRPFRRSRSYRFWQPFRAFKHGHAEALDRIEREFFGAIGVQGDHARA